MNESTRLTLQPRFNDEFALQLCDPEGPLQKILSGIHWKLEIVYQGPHHGQCFLDEERYGLPKIKKVHIFFLNDINDVEKVINKYLTIREHFTITRSIHWDRTPAKSKELGTYSTDRKICKCLLVQKGVMHGRHFEADAQPFRYRDIIWRQHPCGESYCQKILKEIPPIVFWTIDERTRALERDPNDI